MAEEFTCPSCGASLQPHGSDATITCAYCGETVIVPESMRAAPPPAAPPVSARTGPGGITEQQALELVEMVRSGQYEPAIARYMQMTGASRAHAMRVGAMVLEMIKMSGGNVTGEQALNKIIAADEMQGIAETMVTRRMEQSQPASVRPRPRRNSGGCATLLALLLIGFGIYYFFPQAFGTMGKLLGLKGASGKAIQAQILQTVIPPDVQAVATQLPSILSTVNAKNPIPVTVGQQGGAAAASFATVVLMKGEEGAGAGKFQDARRIAVDGQGKVYVADHTGERVQVYDTGGQYMGQWSVNPNQPVQALAADRSGTVYVVQSGAISRYQGATGMPLGKIPSARGTRFSDLAIMPDGNLAAVDTASSDDTVILTPGGKVVQTIPRAVSGHTGRPEADMRVAVDALGNIDLLGISNGVVVKYGPDGSYVTRWGSPGNQPGQFNDPTGIAVDNQDRIYVSDANGIQVFDASGHSLAAIPSGQERYFDMVFDAGNDLFVAAGTKWVLMKVSAENP